MLGVAEISSVLSPHVITMEATRNPNEVEVKYTAGKRRARRMSKTMESLQELKASIETLPNGSDTAASLTLL